MIKKRPQCYTTKRGATGEESMSQLKDHTFCSLIKEAQAGSAAAVSVQKKFAPRIPPSGGACFLKKVGFPPQEPHRPRPCRHSPLSKARAPSLRDPSWSEKKCRPPLLEGREARFIVCLTKV